MSIAAYLQVSTQLQAQAQTSEQQLEHLRAHIQQTGGTLLHKYIFHDHGYSGGSLNRPELDALRDQVKAGEVERVLITAPDRLAYNYSLPDGAAGRVAAGGLHRRVSGPYHELRPARPAAANPRRGNGVRADLDCPAGALLP